MTNRIKLAIENIAIITAISVSALSFAGCKGQPPSENSSSTAAPSSSISSISAASQTKVISSAVSLPASSAPPVSKSSSKKSSSNGNTDTTSVKRNSFFDDSVFVGDSMTDAISLLDSMDNAHVVSVIGLSAYTAVTTKQKIGGKNIMVADAVANCKPSKIFIMLGSNDLEWMSAGKFLTYYGKLIDNLQKLCPNAVIYLESITPVTASYENRCSNHTNAMIDSFNSAIKSYAAQRNLKFLDIGAQYKNSAGKLPDNISEDGMHFYTEYYGKWINYILEHK